MPHSEGDLVASDWMDKAYNDPVFGIFKQCGFWTMDEADILFQCASQIGGKWLDVGGHTGWTAAHLAAAGCLVTSIDPMYLVPEFRDRAKENLRACGLYDRVTLWGGTSDEYFHIVPGFFDGFVIDGDHEGQAPLEDAKAAADRSYDHTIILIHDGKHESAKRAFRHLSRVAWERRSYNTAHGVGLFYRHSGFFSPPGVAF